MKAFIINLKSAEKRRQHAVRQAERFELDFTLIEGVDGSKLSEVEIAEKCDLAAIRENPQWLSRGMIGASLSHIKVYEEIVRRDLEYALVLEDDAQLSPQFRMVIDQISKQHLGNEILLIHYTSFAPLELSTFRSTPLAEEFDLLLPMFLRGVGSAACYVISRRAAESLISNLMPIRLAPDSFYDFAECGYIDRVRCVYPMAAGVVGAKSTIDVTNQSSFRRFLARKIEEQEIPIIYGFMRRMRLKSVRSRSVIKKTTARSPFDT